MLTAPTITMTITMTRRYSRGALVVVLAGSEDESRHEDGEVDKEQDHPSIKPKAEKRGPLFVEQIYDHSVYHFQVSMLSNRNIEYHNRILQF